MQKLKGFGGIDGIGRLLMFSSSWRMDPRASRDASHLEAIVGPRALNGDAVRFESSLQSPQERSLSDSNSVSHDAVVTTFAVGRGRKTSPGFAHSVGGDRRRPITWIQYRIGISSPLA